MSPAPQAGYRNDNLQNLGVYENGYILELRPQPDLKDEVTKALDENFTKMADYLDDSVYIQFSKLDKDILPMTLQKEWNRTHPGLVITDEHPYRIDRAERRSYNLDDAEGYLYPYAMRDELNQNLIRGFVPNRATPKMPQEKKGDVTVDEVRAILFEFDDATSQSEVTKVLRKIANHIENEDFMTELTWEKRKMRLKKSIEPAVDMAGLAVSVITFGL